MALSEFLVASALKVTEQPRTEWDFIDIQYKSKKIEVKSAAYIQSWPQDKISTIRFDIGKKKGWDSSTNTYLIEPVRSSDCYVFCLFTEKDIDKANVLDCNQWRFFVVDTKEINLKFRNQKSISLSVVEQLTKPVSYSKLRETVDSI